MSVDATVDINLNNASGELTVYEDINDDGVAENKDTVQLKDGNNVYTLSSLAGGDATDYDYWFSVDYSTSNVENSASITGNSVILNTVQAKVKLNLTTVGGDRQVSLSWDDTGFDSVNIYRAQSKGANLGDYTKIDSVSSGVTSYTDTGASEDGERYHYRIESREAGSQQAVSQNSASTTNLPKANNVDVTSYDTDAGTATVEWNNQDNSSDGFIQIYRSTTQGNLGSSVSGQLSVGTTSFSDSGLTSNTEYYYTVRRETDHASVDSNQGEVFDIWGSVTPGSRQNGLAWNDTGFDSIKVYRAQSSSPGDLSGYTEIANLSSGTTSYTDTGADEDGEKYYYKLETLTSGTRDRLSFEQFGITDLSAVKNASVAFDSGKTAVVVSWDKNDNSSDGDTKVYRSQSSGTKGSNISGSLDPSTTKYDDSNPEEGDTYYYTVERNTDHASQDSSQLSITLAFNVPSLSVQNTKLNGDVTVGWTSPNTTTDGFRVFESDDGGASFTEIASLGPNQSGYTAQTGQQFGIYQYYIEEFNANEVEKSATVTAAPYSVGGTVGINETREGYSVDENPPAPLLNAEDVGTESYSITQADTARILTEYADPSTFSINDVGRVTATTTSAAGAPEITITQAGTILTDLGVAQTSTFTISSSPARDVNPLAEIATYTIIPYGRNVRGTTTPLANKEGTVTSSFTISQNSFTISQKSVVSILTEGAISSTYTVSTKSPGAIPLDKDGSLGDVGYSNTETISFQPQTAISLTDVVENVTTININQAEEVLLNPEIVQTSNFSISQINVVLTNKPLVSTSTYSYSDVQPAADPALVSTSSYTIDGPEVLGDQIVEAATYEISSIPPLPNDIDAAGVVIDGKEGVYKTNTDGDLETK